MEKYTTVEEICNAIADLNGWLFIDLHPTSTPEDLIADEQFRAHINEIPDQVHYAPS